MDIGDVGSNLEMNIHLCDVTPCSLVGTSVSEEPTAPILQVMILGP
jgi:hypothetical protein